MALTLTELSTARESLRRARTGGVRRCTDQKGKTVGKKSDGEVARTLAALDPAIAAATPRPPSTIIFRTSKGL